MSSPEQQPPPGSGCSCPNLLIALAQFAGLVLGIVWGARRGIGYTVLGALGGVVAGTVAAVLTVIVVGLLAFGALSLQERLRPRPPPARSRTRIPKRPSRRHNLAGKFATVPANRHGSERSLAVRSPVFLRTNRQVEPTCRRVSRLAR
jgi:hypothetical protein